MPYCTLYPSIFHSHFLFTHEQWKDKWKLEQKCWNCWLLLGNAQGVTMVTQVAQVLGWTSLLFLLLFTGKFALMRAEVSLQMLSSYLNQSQSLFASHDRRCCLLLIVIYRLSFGCKLETGEELALRIRQVCQWLLLLMWHKEVLHLKRHAGWSDMDDIIDMWYEMIQPNKPKGTRISILSSRTLLYYLNFSFIIVSLLLMVGYLILEDSHHWRYLLGLRMQQKGI